MKKLYTLVCLLLCPVLLFCACAPQQTEADAAKHNNKTEETADVATDTATGSTPQTSATPAPTINTDVTYDYTFARQYTPFWLDDVMYNECLCFVKGDDGSIRATLGFKPLKIVAVYDWSLKKQLVEGVDYVYDADTNTLVRPEGSSVPYFTQNFLHGKNEDGSLIDAFVSYDKAPWTTLGYARWKNAIHCIGPELYEKQMFITYVYDSSCAKSSLTAKYQGDKLSNVITKLKNKEQVRILYCGDSIPYGCDASRMYNRDPRQDGFPKIVRKALEELYGTDIKYYNTSEGGTTSQWCLDNVQEKIIDYNPDLVFLLTAGNDDRDKLEQAKQNVMETVTAIKKALPDCNVILMDCFVGNADGDMEIPEICANLQPAFDVIASQTEGVASVGIYYLHKALLQNKNYIDFSSNGINHPNDYMIRIYAQQLVATLYDFEGNR